MSHEALNPEQFPEAPRERQRMTAEVMAKSRLTGIAAKAQATGTVDSFKTIHEAAMGYDEAGSVADSLGLDTVTDKGIKRASNQIRRASQVRMEHDRYPEQFRVYRAGENKGVVSVSTRPLTVFKDQRPHVVNRRDVLTYGEGLQQGTFKEDELHVEADKLKPL